MQTRAVPYLAAIATLLQTSCGGTNVKVGGADGGGSSSVSLRNVDVTVIYPLPMPGRVNDLVSPSDAATAGPYLAASLFPDGVPDLDAVSPLPTIDERLHSLRVVAVRFDPCPGVVAPGAAPAPAPTRSCEPEIRVVYQSILDDGSQLVARDGAVHAFYRLSTTDFGDVIGELRAVRRERAGEPEGILDRSPILQSEGLQGGYAQRLRSILERYATEKNAVRVTSFTRTAGVREPQKGTWEFAIRERTNGVFANTKIATTQTKTQTLRTIVGGRWDADITPAVTTADDVTRIFKVSTHEQEETAFRASVRVLNPRVHTSESIDCATCHLAPDVATFARVTRGFDDSKHEERFQSSYPLGSASITEEEVIAFENMHLLSYLGRRLKVSSRVANETAAVLEALNPTP
jgi:hypothetical protein